VQAKRKAYQRVKAELFKLFSPFYLHHGIKHLSYSGTRLYNDGVTILLPIPSANPKLFLYHEVNVLLHLLEMKSIN
jgi:hypothetical protein